MNVKMEVWNMRKYYGFIFVIFFLICFHRIPVSASDTDIENYPRIMAEEFCNEVSANSSLIFGVKIKESIEEWTVKISPGKMELTNGLPKEPTFCFVTDKETFLKIATKKMNPLTAMARARMNEPAPMDVIPLNGFVPDKEFIGKLLPLTYSFFITGAPEIIYFGEEFSRKVHGGKAVAFYYTPGLRSAWYKVKKGMMINKDFEKSPNPFPSYFIVIKGKGKAKIGEKEIELREEMGFLVPAGVLHQFWVEEGEMEFIVIMFGKGA